MKYYIISVIIAFVINIVIMIASKSVKQMEKDGHLTSIGQQIVFSLFIMFVSFVWPIMLFKFFIVPMFKTNKQTNDKQ